MHAYALNTKEKKSVIKTFVVIVFCRGITLLIQQKISVGENLPNALIGIVFKYVFNDKSTWFNGIH